MYINHNNLNINFGGMPTTPQFGSGASCNCSGSMDASAMYAMQNLAGSVAGMGFLGGMGGMMGGFSPMMSPGFGGMPGIGAMGGAGNRKATKSLAKAIRGLTKFLGAQGKGKKKGKKKSKKA